MEEQGDQKKEKLSRLGLCFQRGKAILWQWVNEGMTDDLTREEYPKIENYPNPENALYDFYIEQLNAMTEALARKNGQDPATVKEVFRSAAIGPGSLFPLRKLIRPPFKSLIEFIKVTDSPMNFAFSLEGVKKVFNKLWREIESGQAETSFQKELKANQEKLLVIQELVLESLEALKQVKNKDYAEAKNKVRKMVETCDGLDWLFGEDWTSVKRFLEADNDHAYIEAEAITLILTNRFQALPVLALIANHPEIKEFTQQYEISKIDTEELEKLYLNSLGVE